MSSGGNQNNRHLCETPPPRENRESTASPQGPDAALTACLSSLTRGYPVVRVRKPRCPRCNAVAKGRPQHSEKHETMSVQRRKCQVCSRTYIVLVE